ncbi:MAG TPA: hypothetical protein VGR35_15090 [Tepidisphaeraceae bacterium]|nr:hypothetical protein [Tepidisphaeraceae bacterium]
MSDPVSDSAAAPPPPSQDRSPAAPLFCWLAIHLLALSLAVFRVPLSARFPLPGEQFAIHLTLAAAVVASAMLFPFLLRDAKTSVMMILTIAPFVQLSSYLSLIPPGRAALAGLYVATWLITLALWRTVLRSQRAQMLGVSCALALSMGGAILWYVRAESPQPEPIDWSRDGMCGPILGAMAQLHARPVPPSTWIISVLLLVVSSVIVITVRKRRVGRSGTIRGAA